jgi:predicted O-linked N-acetylglucosamine transferase (SPINDLY family)
MLEGALAAHQGGGLDAMDYRLTDPYLDPVGMDESVYTEKSIRLPPNLPGTWRRPTARCGRDGVANNAGNVD